MRNQSMEAAGSEGVSLRVDFVWREDRYGQVISAVDLDGSVMPLLESQEGSKVDPYPASPPFQNLSIESLADGRRAALLVGMAGRSHWSGSVELVVGAAGLVFDIACRVGESDPVLGSRYLLVRENQLVARLTSHCPDVEFQAGKYRLVVAKIGETNADYDRDQQRLTICSAQYAAVAAGQTVRWKYEVRLWAN